MFLPVEKAPILPLEKIVLETDSDDIELVRAFAQRSQLFSFTEQALPTCGEINSTLIETHANFPAGSNGKWYNLLEWTNYIPPDCIPVVVTHFQNAADQKNHVIVSFLGVEQFHKLGGNDTAMAEACENHLFPGVKYPDNLQSDLKSACYDQGQAVNLEILVDGQLRQVQIVLKSNQMHFALEDQGLGAQNIAWNVRVTKELTLSQMIDRMIKNYRADLGDASSQKISFPIIEKLSLPMPDEDIVPQLDPLLSTPTPMPTWTPSAPPTFTPFPTANPLETPHPEEVAKTIFGFDKEFQVNAKGTSLVLTIPQSEKLTYYTINNPNANRISYTSPDGKIHFEPDRREAKLRAMITNPRSNPEDILKLIKELDKEADRAGWYKFVNFWGQSYEKVYPEAEKLSLSNGQLILENIRIIRTSTETTIIGEDPQTHFLTYFKMNKSLSDNFELTTPSQDQSLRDVTHISHNLRNLLLWQLSGDHHEKGFDTPGFFLLPPEYSHILWGKAYPQAEIAASEIESVTHTLPIILVNGQGQLKNAQGNYNYIDFPTSSYFNFMGTFIGEDGLRYALGSYNLSTQGLPTTVLTPGEITAYYQQFANILGPSYDSNLLFAIPIECAATVDLPN